MKILINLETGNAAMQTSMDIVTAIQEAAISIGCALDRGETGTGVILDENGNTVGKWETWE